ncbi:hypothetical protein FGO68_gene5391 [Halteria grandinella]|uniref:Uncharacterized protein n=1 Tax=Halteria grandinella TaxID=5974 RepID=A0A8J8T1A2_HALGN|nr:hypothetical protein FGO68_gene5391 [Halteria grandinella]
MQDQLSMGYTFQSKLNLAHNYLYQKGFYDYRAQVVKVGLESCIIICVRLSLTPEVDFPSIFPFYCFAFRGSIGSSFFLTGKGFGGDGPLTSFLLLLLELFLCFFDFFLSLDLFLDLLLSFPLCSSSLFHAEIMALLSSLVCLLKLPDFLGLFTSSSSSAAVFWLDADLLRFFDFLLGLLRFSGLEQVFLGEGKHVVCSSFFRLIKWFNMLYLQFPRTLILRMLIIHHLLDLFPQLPPHMLKMHKVAVPASVTSPLRIQPAPCLLKVRHRTILHPYSLPAVVPPIHPFIRVFSITLIVILAIHIAHHMFANIVTNVHFCQFSILSQLQIHFLIEILKMRNCLNQEGIWHCEAVCEGNCGGRVVVEVGEQQGLGGDRAVVDARAGVSVAAAANFEVERAIYSKRGQEMVGGTCLLLCRRCGRVYPPQFQLKVQNSHYFMIT